MDHLRQKNYPSRESIIMAIKLSGSRMDLSNKLMEEKDYRSALHMKIAAREALEDFVSCLSEEDESAIIMKDTIESSKKIEKSIEIYVLYEDMSAAILKAKALGDLEMADKIAERLEVILSKATKEISVEFTRSLDVIKTVRGKLGKLLSLS